MSDGFESIFPPRRAGWQGGKKKEVRENICFRRGEEVCRDRDPVDPGKRTEPIHNEMTTTDHRTRPAREIGRAHV